MRLKRKPFLTAALMPALGLVVATTVASANVTGFGTNGTGWTLNDNGNYTPTITGNNLELTSAADNEATSVWYNTQQDVASSWSATFTWTQSNGNSPPANGFMFVVQTLGTNALGGSGGSKGYSNGTPNITPSVAMGMDPFSNPFYTGGFQYGQDGSIENSNPTGSLDFQTDLNPIEFTVAYNAPAETLTIAAVDSTNSADSSSYTQSAVNIATILRQNTAYIGLTGGTGGSVDQQNITKFSFAVPEPSVLALLAIGGAGLLLLGRRRGRA